MAEQIRIEGLAAISRSLRKIDAEAPKQLRLVFNDAATLLVDRTRPKIPTRTGAARASLKARSTRTSARVGVGGRKAPYYPWLDFGGEGKRPGRPAHRTFYPEGRYLYVTLSDIRPEIATTLSEGLASVIADVGLDEG